MPRKTSAVAEPVEVMRTSARARIREVVKLRIEGADEISIPALTDSLVALLQGDAEFMREFVSTALRSEVYTHVSNAIAASRQLTQIGDEAITAEAMTKRAERFATRFMGWFEHSGERHVNLMDMTREDLLVAASERRKRGNREYKIAALWTQIADGLEGGQKVQERFTAEEIEGLYSRIESATEGVAA